MTIIMMVSYISCPFPAKAEALLPCACTEAPLPLKRPGEEGSARCSLLEFRQLQKWPILCFDTILTPKKGDTSRGIQKTRVSFMFCVKNGIEIQKNFGPRKINLKRKIGLS